MDQDEEYQRKKEEEKDERYRLHREFIETTLGKILVSRVWDEQVLVAGAGQTHT